MPRPPNVDPLRATIRNLGQQIGQELAAAFTNSFNSSVDKNGVRNGLSGAKRGRPASVSGGAACAVAGCGRKRAAKGLCQNHYAKAHRLKMNLEKLGASDYKLLGEDGRATRWSK